METWSSIDRSPLCNAAGAEIGLQMPGTSGIGRALAAPAKRVRRDVAEAPAQMDTMAHVAELHDVCTLRAPDLARVERLERVAPVNMPSIYRRVINTQGGAMEYARQDPHIHDGAAVQCPDEMDLALPAVEHHLVRAVGSGTRGDEGVDKSGR